MVDEWPLFMPRDGSETKTGRRLYDTVPSALILPMDRVMGGFDRNGDESLPERHLEFSRLFLMVHGVNWDGWLWCSAR